MSAPPKADYTIPAQARPENVPIVGSLEGMDDVILPLIAIEDDWTPCAVGSCSVVGLLDEKRALIATAARNLVPAYELAGLKRSPPPQRSRILFPEDYERNGDLPKGFVSLTNVGNWVLFPDGPGLRQLQVVDAWWELAYDVALGLVEIPPELPHLRFVRSFAVDTSEPAEGTEIGVLSHSPVKATLEEAPPGRRVRVQLHRKQSLGRVGKSGMSRVAKCPGFFLSAAIDSGMSGSPIIRMRGQIPTVVGVASSDLSGDHGDEGSGDAGFACHIWQLGLIETNIESPTMSTGHTDVPSYGIDLLRAGYIPDFGDAVDLVLVAELDGQKAKGRTGILLKDNHWPPHIPRPRNTPQVWRHPGAAAAKLMVRPRSPS